MKNKRKNHFLIRFYDKLIVIALFSFFTACDDPEPSQPVPEYGVQPMYGTPTAQIDTQNKIQ
ncbi:MAG: hypothetical protein H6Q20_515 [Bacteroidetes bacterium]|nr:hypothetical protein [Bacteroidota bacterium]